MFVSVENKSWWSYITECVIFSLKANNDLFMRPFVFLATLRNIFERLKCYLTVINIIDQFCIHLIHDMSDKENKSLNIAFSCVFFYHLIIENHALDV